MILLHHYRQKEIEINKEDERVIGLKACQRREHVYSRNIERQKSKQIEEAQFTDRSHFGYSHWCVLYNIIL
jgi:hypothetical protein